MANAKAKTGSAYTHSRQLTLKTDLRDICNNLKDLDGKVNIANRIPGSVFYRGNLDKTEVIVEERPIRVPFGTTSSRAITSQSLLATTTTFEYHVWAGSETTARTHAQILEQASEETYEDLSIAKHGLAFHSSREESKQKTTQKPYPVFPPTF